MFYKKDRLSFISINTSIGTIANLPISSLFSFFIAHYVGIIFNKVEGGKQCKNENNVPAPPSFLSFNFPFIPYE